MSFFDEVAKETMGVNRNPKWHRDHTYHLRIDKYDPVFQTRSAGSATVIEFVVIASSCREHPAGQRISLMIYHTADSAKQNLSKILRAALGVKNNPEGKLYYETTIQPHAATYAQDARYFVGKEITVTTVTNVSKEGNEYVGFTAEPLRLGADGKPEALAERETKPLLQNGKGNWQKGGQAAAPSPGYGYPPPGYGYPPKA